MVCYFEIPDGGNEVNNQIANLRVKEENIVYCWSVLRKTAQKKTLEKIVLAHSKKIGFKGSVVVAVGDSPSDQAACQYGETFRDLALISSRRYDSRN